MKISSIHITNFRSFADSEIHFNNYTCLVGPNGAGKSTILTALNVFFRETLNSQTKSGNLSEEDFHQRNIDDPITVKVTFTDLSPEAEKEFSDYVRHGKLVISAVAKFDSTNMLAEVKQYGERLVMKEFAEYFEAKKEKKKANELKEIYRSFQESFPTLPPPTNMAQMEEELRNYERDHPEQCTLVASADEFYGFTRGSNRLAKFVQWIYVPAVKDATEEQVESKNTALGKILGRTVRAQFDIENEVNNLRIKVQKDYQKLIDDHQQHLDGITSSLNLRISEWAHPDATIRLKWKQDAEKSVRLEEPWAHIIAGEGEFKGELSRFGHGLQRSYLLALLQELSETDQSVSPTLILGCEEPELYQHPPQTRHLASVFLRLSSMNSQVVVTTHNPLFVSGRGFPDVRLVRKSPCSIASSVSQVSIGEITDLIGSVYGESQMKSEGMRAKNSSGSSTDFERNVFHSTFGLG